MRKNILLIIVILIMDLLQIHCQIDFDPTTITNEPQYHRSIHLHARIDNSILFPGSAYSTIVDGVLRDLNSNIINTNSIIISSNYELYSDHTLLEKKSFLGRSLV